MKEGDLSVEQISELLRERVRVGQGLSVPYARKWDVGWCTPKHSLWKYPHDPLRNFCSGLIALNRRLIWTADGLQVGNECDALWVGIDRSLPGEGPPFDYLVGRPDSDTAIYVGNSPEVILEILDAWSDDPVVNDDSNELQIGFPAMEKRRPKYVGSWQWNIHGEASDDDVIRRAAAATLAAIRKARG